MHQKSNLVSVIIPVYNVCDYLEKCIASVLAQTYKNLEIIIVNDGSTDGSKKICEKLLKTDQRIKLVNRPNGGLSAARNTGIKKATGKYICFIDSDDYVEPNYVEILYNAITSNNADMSIGGHITRYPSGKDIERYNNAKYVDTPHNILAKLLYDDGIDTSAWAKLYKKELFNNIEFPEGKVFEDTATTYKLIHASKTIAVRSVPIYNYIIRESSISNEGFSPRKIELIEAAEKMTSDIKSWYPDLSNGCNRRLMHAYLSTLSQLAKVKKRYPKIERELISYIKKHGKEVLKDKSIPKRDRIGILAARHGFTFYKFSWKLYLFFSGRRYE